MLSVSEARQLFYRYTKEAEAKVRPPIPSQRTSSRDGGIARILSTIAAFDRRFVHVENACTTMTKEGRMQTAKLDLVLKHINRINRQDDRLPPPTRKHPSS